MTMAAVAALALTRATSSGVRSAELGGAGFSPCGPLLKILPSALANAASAAWDTPVASLCVVELGKLQQARPSTSATGTRVKWDGRFMRTPPGGECARTDGCSRRRGP